MDVSKSKMKLGIGIDLNDKEYCIENEFVIFMTRWRIFSNPFPFEPDDTIQIA